jgi:hypothetical protein
MCANSEKLICVILFLMYMLQIADKIDDINEDSYGYLEYGFDKFCM